MRKILATRKASSKVAAKGGRSRRRGNLDVRSGGEAAFVWHRPVERSLHRYFMRLRRFILALALCLGCSLFAAPSPTPTPKPAPSPPLKPSGPVKPLPTPSPTPSAKPTASAKTKTLPPASEKPAATKSTPALKPDAELDTVADEFIRGYLAARPLQATALGFHEYDGRIFEYTRLAIDAELARLRRFDDRLKKFEPDKLSPRAAIDLRLLQAAIRKELFLIQDMAIYEHNPMS